MSETINQILSDYLTEAIFLAIVWLMREVPAKVVAILERFVGEKAAQLAVTSFGDAIRRATVLTATENPQSSPEQIGELVASYMFDLRPDAVAKVEADRPGMVRRAKAELADLGLIRIAGSD